MIFTKKDLLVIAVFLLCAAALCALLYSGALLPRGSTVCVYRDGVLVDTLSLSGNRVLTLSDGIELDIAVSEGSVRVIRSACGGQDCVRSGRISRVGQSILCAPQRVLVRIAGETDAPDAVLR